MIDVYFAELEQVLRAFPNIRSSTLAKKLYNAEQGYLTGSVQFDTGCRLEFMELKDTNRPAKVKYRYQYMDREDTCLFRYDNAPHYRDIATFPHHKHSGDKIEASREPTLFDVLLEIAGRERVNDEE